MSPDRFRAKAAIVYDDKIPIIVCEEPSCEFHQAGSCLNHQVIINDNCPAEQYCESYTPWKHGLSIDSQIKEI